MADTDPRLAVVVLENLLANAWRFTANVSPARINFDEQERDGRRQFSVRDNGLGFDAACSRRLFRPFQRLHTEAEFAGTGIGLATVGRVLDRPGGEYWADASGGGRRDLLLHARAVSNGSCVKRGGLRCPAGYRGGTKERAMNEYSSERDRTKVAADERPMYGRALAVGAVVVWLATMLLLLGPTAAHGLF